MNVPTDSVAAQGCAICVNLVQDLQCGLEAIQQLVFLVTSECGRSGQYLHLAMSNMASNLVALAEAAIGSASTSDGVCPDAVEEIDIGLRAISHLASLADEECGQSGQHLHYAIGELAAHVAVKARAHVDAVYSIEVKA